MNKDAKAKVTTEKRIRKSIIGKPPRLYLRGVFTGFRRGKTTQDENHALVKIEGLNSRKEVSYYLGKRLVYARFLHNLPPKAIGGTIRVMLYPHRVHV